MALPYVCMKISEYPTPWGLNMDSNLKVLKMSHELFECRAWEGVVTLSEEFTDVVNNQKGRQCWRCHHVLTFERH